ncbi:hypothetical protein D7X32_24310 [Corallococcus carmarthensis]|uniref:Uncharacterized protein n=1 Tax=Corallococcus carmarthensis TaxID=2316728 RepID=A0A3A8JYB0_9BACT|nr:hypothetical protein D7X32_24310 [Corallococcus carmarthensis]
MGLGQVRQTEMLEERIRQALMPVRLLWRALVQVCRERCADRDEVVRMQQFIGAKEGERTGTGLGFAREHA